MLPVISVLRDLDLHSGETLSSSDTLKNFLPLCDHEADSNLGLLMHPKSLD